MKPTDQNHQTARHAEISVSDQAALSEIFSTMTIGVGFAPARIARALNTRHRQSLSRLLERIENGEIKDEHLERLWRAHHASDRFVLMAPIVDVIRQISHYLPGRRP
ncbi:MULTISPECIES: hypothetical protein [Agrobacterium]|uniref:Uncharacterized protein n=1 Tax=Agrobacterium tumefaciens TaxID=358 RepID=A0AAE6BCX7_AGRTU|nr:MULTISPECIES: hypothetical protein [Agrobacterium]QCL73505.1 hypothetical protein CFBP5499_08825 [Agrobacterium tumefaciens]QCL79077.1 hypothetical protein CFBP5877_08355 [Agrobacterium tumefaciens]